MGEGSQEDLRRQLETTERELYNLNIRCARLDGAPVPSSGSRRPSSVVTPAMSHSGTVPQFQKLTRSNFLAMQSQARSPRTDGNRHGRPMGPTELDGFIFDLISQPSRSRRPSAAASACVSPRLSMNNFEEEIVPEEGVVTRSLSAHSHLDTVGGIATRQYAAGKTAACRVQPSSNKKLSPIAQLDYTVEDEDESDKSDSGDDLQSTRSETIRVRERQEMQRAFEERLAQERAKMDAQFQASLVSMKQEIDEVRSRRRIDSQKWSDLQDEMERALKDSREELMAATDKARRVQQEIQALKVKLDDREHENERLEKELNQANTKAERLQSRRDEMQNVITILRRDNEDMIARISKLEKHVATAEASVQAAAARVQETASKNAAETDKVCRLEAESTRLAEEVGKLTTEIAKKSAESQRDAAIIQDLRGTVERIEARATDRDRACRLAEDRIEALQKELREETAERERAQQTAVELQDRHIETIRLQTKVDELAAAVEGLHQQLHIARLDSDRAHSTAARLRQEKLMLTNAKMTMDQEMQRLRRDLREVKRSVNFVAATSSTDVARENMPAIRSRQPGHNDLLDFEGKPLSRLAPARTIQEQDIPVTGIARPRWWTELGTEAPRSSPTGIETSFNLNPSEGVRRASGRAGDSVIVPVPGRRTETENSSNARISRETVDTSYQPRDNALSLLQAEKRELQLALRRMPKNAAFRTSDQVEEHGKLLKQLDAIELEIQRILISKAAAASKGML